MTPEERAKTAVAQWYTTDGGLLFSANMRADFVEQQFVTAIREAEQAERRYGTTTKPPEFPPRVLTTSIHTLADDFPASNLSPVDLHPFINPSRKPFGEG